MDELPVFAPTEVQMAGAVAHPTCSHALVDQLVADDDVDVEIEFDA